MEKLEQRIHDGKNGLDYVLVGDYYLPALALPEQDSHRRIGKWGAMHRDYLREANPILYNQLVLECRLHAYLSDLNEQAQDRYERIVRQMMKTEGVTEDLKRRSQMDWIRAMNSIVNRAEGLSGMR
jgi:hypothetical protein